MSTPHTALTTARRGGVSYAETALFGTPEPTVATSAHAAADSTAVSARAAYQMALYGRGILLDVRPPDERRRDGRLDPSLTPLATAADAAWAVRAMGALEASAPQPAILVVGGRSARSRTVAEALRRLGLGRVQAVRGGFAAWRAEGLPVVLAD